MKYADGQITSLPKQIYAMAVSFALGFVISAICSISISPLYDFCGFDSSIFRVVGRVWAEGALPYLDAWDSKGPIIFAVNALGEYLGGREALWILESLALTVSFFIAYRFFSLGDNRYKSTLWLTVTFGIVTGAVLDYGNRTESYDLPFLMLSYMSMYKSVEDRMFPAMRAFIYGVTLGITLWLRLLDFAGVGIGVLLLALMMFREKKWHILIINAGAFLAGVALITIPVTLWASSAGIFDEMWYATFTYNLTYLSHGGSNTTLLSLARIPERLHLIAIPLVTLGIAITLWLKGEDKPASRQGLFWTIIALGVTLVMMSGRGYAHYAMTTLPLFCVSVLMIGLIPRGQGKRVAAIVLATVLTALTVWSAQRITRAMHRHRQHDKTEAVANLAKIVPYHERSQLWLYEVAPETYLKVNNLRPIRPLFCLQSDMIDLDHARFKAEIENFEACRPLWILTDTTMWEPLSPTLDRDYEIVAHQEKFVLMKRVDKGNLFHL